MLNGHTTETIARFNYDKDRLQITKTYIHFRDRDSLLTDANTSILQSIGIRGNASNYDIKRLTSSSMIYALKMTAWSFINYIKGCHLF